MIVLIFSYTRGEKEEIEKGESSSVEELRDN
jgi:hypothetical protein